MPNGTLKQLLPSYVKWFIEALIHALDEPVTLMLADNIIGELYLDGEALHWRKATANDNRAE